MGHLILGSSVQLHPIFTAIHYFDVTEILDQITAIHLLCGAGCVIVYIQNYGIGKSHATRRCIRGILQPINN